MKVKMVEPPRVSKLPHYKGLPVTFTTFVDENGIPNFKAIDDDKVWEAKRDGLCSICGDKLDYWIAFMVDEKEAKTREVYDNPNHEECLRFAFNICPWLYYSKSTYSDIDKLNKELKDSGYTYVNNHPSKLESLERAPVLGIYITNNYRNVITKARFRVCKVGNAKRIEWIEGR